MTTMETIKETAAALRDQIEEFLDENEGAVDDDTASILYTLEANVNDWLGDTEEMPE